MLMLLEIVQEESVCPNAKKKADRLRPISPVEFCPVGHKVSQTAVEIWNSCSRLSSI
jgi:hypothetical protein